MEETWEHISVHWQQGKFQLWANCFTSFERRPQNVKDTFHSHCCVQCANHSAMTHPSKRIGGLAPAERYQTLNTTASCVWAFCHIYIYMYKTEFYVIFPHIVNYVSYPNNRHQLNNNLRYVTKICIHLFCSISCDYIIRPSGLMWSIQSYHLGLLYLHWNKPPSAALVPVK